MAIETVPEWMAGLEDEDLVFIKKFVLASGSLKEMAGEYGVTYPTVRLRLDRLIQKIKLSEDTAADPGVEPRFDPAETAARLTAAEGELSRLRGGLAMAQGELNSLGDREELTARREAILEELDRRSQKIGNLKKMHVTDRNT